MHLILWGAGGWGAEKFGGLGGNWIGGEVGWDETQPLGLSTTDVYPE